VAARKKQPELDLLICKHSKVMWYASSKTKLKVKEKIDRHLEANTYDHYQGYALLEMDPMDQQRN
jgi:hypothetical protein